MGSNSPKGVVESEEPVPRPIGLVGLGLMGMALAERLLGGGFEIWGYDIDPRRNDLFREPGGRPASGTAEIAAGCRRILLSLPDSDVVRAVLAQMSPSLAPGQIVIDTSTGDPDQAAATGRRLAEGGIGYLDATISGSSQQVRQAEAVVLAGGPAVAFDECQDLFRLFARKWFRLGPCGSGSQMKLVSNLVLGLNRAALAEGLWLGRKLGLDPHQVLTVLRESMAYSRIMDTKGEKMIAGDFQPQAKLSQHHKDVRLILAAAAKAGTDLPLSRTHARLLELAEDAGCGALDNSAIIRAFERLGTPPAADRKDPER
jgi:3-hydroxyisobutyrate dehydrogenase-like beta-hydroxyacid dehydrogenase